MEEPPLRGGDPYGNPLPPTTITPNGVPNCCFLQSLGPKNAKPFAFLWYPSIPGGTGNTNTL